MPAANVSAFAEDYLDPWNRCEEAALRGTYFAPAVVYREIALRETLTGIDAVMNFICQLAQSFPDVEWDVLDADLRHRGGLMDKPRIDRLELDVAGDKVVGNRHWPVIDGVVPAVIVAGPMTSVKEQAT